MLTPTPVADHEKILSALERVLMSHVFARAERSREFLRYLVEAALAQPPAAVKEYTIAVDVFHRDAGYDPSIDATVRVEASRLRGRLREYYDDEGREDALVIEVPKGSYAAVLRRRAPPELRPIELPGEPPQAMPQHPLLRPLPGVTAARNRRPAWFAAGILVLAAIVVLLATRTTHMRGAHSSVPASAPSLAVFPMVNLTGDPHLTPLCDGLTAELIRQLSQLPSLRLISQDAVSRYRQTTANPLDAGRKLGVGAVLTGQWRRAADHSSLFIEISSTQDGTVLLDREYIVENEDLRPVQAELQQDVIETLHMEGLARDPGRRLGSVAASPQAYQEFLEGDALGRSGEPGDLHQAITHFKRAVAMDPRFDLAWSGMASAHVLLGLYFEAPRDHMPQARRFAERALALNPSLGEAHASLGLIDLVYDWNPAAAAAETAAAGAQAAAISTLSCTAHLIENAGKPGRAEELLYRMLTYDPGSPSLISELGCVNYYRGNYPSALVHYRQALAADPRSPIPYWGMGKTLTAEHQYAQAVAVLALFKQRNGVEPPLVTAERGYALGSAGRRQEALAVVRDLEERGRHTYVDPYYLAILYASLKDRDATFAWLDRAYQVRSPFLISLTSEPKWQPLRSDPRFQRLLQRMRAIAAT